MTQRTELQRHAGDGLPFRVSLEAVNKGVGLVAFFLPFTLLALGRAAATCDGINSISHYYYTRLGGDVLVGALCVIGALLLFLYRLPPDREGGAAMVDGYLGHGLWDMRAARLAGLFAFGVALFPASGAGCEGHTGGIARVFLQGAMGDGVNAPVTGLPSFDFWGYTGEAAGVLSMAHYASALGMFLVLAYFSLVVFTRPQSAKALARDDKPATPKRRRNLAYRICGGLIVFAILGLGYNFLFNPEDSDALRVWNSANLTFWFEALGLWAFGLSWSIKGRLFGLMRDEGDRPVLAA